MQATVTSRPDRRAARPAPSPNTLAGAVVGTPGYIAPEIWRGQDATEQSDVYSFGALVVRALYRGGPLRRCAAQQTPRGHSRARRA